MQRIVQLGGALCLSTLMAACTTTRPYNLIDAGARPHIQEMDSVLISKQSEVRAKINTSKLSQYIQGHFAPVLFDLAVNGIRAHKAGKIMQPIRETLHGYDFTQDIQEEFTQALGETKLGDMGELKLLRQEPQGFRAAYIRNSDADAVMFIDVDFAFSPSFNALNLTSHVMVFPIDEALSPYKEKPDTDNLIELSDNIYRNQFVAAIPSGIDLKSSKSENGAAWAEKSSEEMTILMQKAAEKLASHIVADLNTDDVTEEEEEEGAVETDVVVEDVPVIEDAEDDIEDLAVPVQDDAGDIALE